MALRITVDIEGVRETLRAFRELDRAASDVLRDRTLELAELLAARVRAAGMSDTRQSARAAASVKARRDRVPVITAGGTKRANAVLFGSEFGMNRRSGWYANRRYNGSAGDQYRPHRGAASYWFFATVTENQDEVAAAWRQVATELVRRWSS